jgi:pimeloyl-ACP methyl ester carboxylesterase
LLKKLSLIFAAVFIVFNLWAFNILKTMDTKDIEVKLVYKPAQEIYNLITPIKKKAEIKEFLSSDGTKLSYMHIKGDKKSPVIVFCHGNAGNMTRDDNQTKIKFLSDAGYEIFTLDYRGFGKSGGTPEEQGIYRDTNSFISMLNSQYKIPEENIVIWGHSLGSAITINEAAKRNFKGVIIEGAFTSAEDVKNYRVKHKRNANFAHLFVRDYIFNHLKLTQEFLSKKKIAKIKSPMLIIHAVNDEMIPVEMGHQLAKLKPDAKTYFSQIGRHCDSGWQNKPILEFIESLEKTSLSKKDNEIFLYPIEINEKWGFINKKGKVVIKPKYDMASDFSEGLSVVKVGNLWGYIDNTDKFIIKPKFHIANNFHEGLAAAGYEKYSSGSLEEQLIGYINKKGKFVIKPKDLGPYIYDFKDGIVAVQSSDSECTYIDKTGKLLLNPQKFGYFSLEDGVCIPFSEGLLAVEYSDGKSYKYGYVNKNGKLVIKTEAYFPEDFGSDDFIPIGPFNNGFAVVIRGKKHIYIDKKGKTIKNPPIEIQKDFSEGLSCEYNNDKYIYTDKNGKTGIKAIFDYAESFNHGLARVEINHKSGYIDKTGKFVWSQKIKD